ncbi:hypothetical protein M0R04_04765 [Candidatus Dojkabacteria bacterium]|nr:hypothetical protein [Candidatus Dojkabacteria bacterium]
MTDQIKEKAEEWFDNNYSTNAEITNVWVATHRPSNIVLEHESDKIHTRVLIDYEYQGKEQFCEYLEYVR